MQDTRINQLQAAMNVNTAAIANLNIYEKDNIVNATLSIRLNLEAIIADVNMDHSNTEESEKSGQYESLRTKFLKLIK